jgi:hypothetical protein
MADGAARQFSPDALATLGAELREPDAILEQERLIAAPATLSLRRRSNGAGGHGARHRLGRPAGARADSAAPRAKRQYRIARTVLPLLAKRHCVGGSLSRRRLSGKRPPEAQTM